MNFSDDWKKPLQDLAARVSNERMREQLAQLLEQATEVSIQAAAGLPQSQRDLEILKASILHIVATETQETAAALEAAARARLRQFIWGTLFGLAIP